MENINSGPILDLLKAFLDKAVQASKDSFESHGYKIDETKDIKSDDGSVESTILTGHGKTGKFQAKYVPLQGNRLDVFILDDKNHRASKSNLTQQEADEFVLAFGDKYLESFDDITDDSNKQASDEFDAQFNSNTAVFKLKSVTSSTAFELDKVCCNYDVEQANDDITEILEHAYDGDIELDTDTYYQLTSLPEEMELAEIGQVDSLSFDETIVDILRQSLNLYAKIQCLALNKVNNTSICRFYDDWLCSIHYFIADVVRNVSLSSITSEIFVPAFRVDSVTESSIHDDLIKLGCAIDIYINNYDNLPDLQKVLGQFAAYIRYPGKQGL